MRRDTNHIFRKQSPCLAAIIAVALTFLGAQATAWANQAAAAVAPRSAPALSTSAASPPSARRPQAMDQTYAAREAKAKDLEKFRGGDVVVIGTTTLLIVLLVVIIVILI